MKRFIYIFAASTLLFASLPGSAVAGNGLIYGRIIMKDGDSYEGLIRWDRNEGSWIDLLHGNMKLAHDGGDNCRGDDSKQTISIFGFIKIETDRDDSGVTRSAVSFGNIRRLEVLGSDRAGIVLKSGHQIKLQRGSSDIGETIREIMVEDADEGKFEIYWNDIDRIDFMKTPEGVRPASGERLYGTLVTRSNDTYTGWVCWDEDELFTGDILDGDEGARTREISFGRIKSIERNDSNSARVTLKSQKELILEDSNDVDDSNRGITVYVENFGLVTVYWDEFDRLDFQEEPYQIGYDDFDGGYRLSGTVYNDEGAAYTGRIRWDNDEEWSWDFLDCEFREVDYEVEFRNISSIERVDSDSAMMILHDGTRLRVSGSNDVNYENKGIYIISDSGSEDRVCWDHFDRIVFDYSY